MRADRHPAWPPGPRGAARRRRAGGGGFLLALAAAALACVPPVGTAAAPAPEAAHPVAAVAAAPETVHAVAPAPAVADSLACGAESGGDPAAADAAPRARDPLAEVAANFTAENRAYSGTRAVLRFVEPVYAALVGLLLLFSGLAARLRDIAHGFGHRRYVRVLVFFALYAAIAFVLDFPLAWYRGFALEHQYGLSTQGLGAWLGDEIKGIVVGVFSFGVVPILALVYLAIHRSPKRWWLWVGLGTLPLICAGALVGPVVIDPLFNRFTPLRDARLEARILDLAERAEIPGRHVFEVDKSAQTRKYNAYVAGFGASQRIVLWDTLLDGMDTDEILFVMGHEIGHYRLGHVWRGILLFSILSFALFYLVAGLGRWAVARFGGRWGFRELDDVASLPLLATLLTVLTFLASPATHALSRHSEREADVFALELTRDNDAGARAFVKLGAQNRSNPDPSPVVRLFQHTHPPLVERIRFALDYRPWEEGRTNRLFHGRPLPAPR